MQAQLMHVLLLRMWQRVVTHLSKKLIFFPPLHYWILFFKNLDPEGICFCNPLNSSPITDSYLCTAEKQCTKSIKWIDNIWWWITKKITLTKGYHSGKDSFSIHIDQPLDACSLNLPSPVAFWWQALSQPHKPTSSISTQTRSECLSGGDSCTSTT